MSISPLFRNYRFLVLLIGLTITSLFTIVGIAVSQSVVITADKNLEQYWRTTYDILVRPTGSRSLIENKYGLVAANHLSGINGGISFQQYELIKSIPGVETAAPIAMVGYIEWWGDTKGFPLPEAGAYLLETSFHANDGLTPVRQEERAYYFISRDDELTIIVNEGFPPLYVNPPDELLATLFQTGLLAAGIEPSQESKLIGLDKAVIDGQYLTDNMPLFPMLYLSAHSYCPLNDCPEVEIALPMLINHTTHIDMTMHSTLYSVSLDPGVDSLENLRAHGGTEYLASRPSEIIGSEITDSAWVHQNTVEKLKVKGDLGTSLYGLPAPLEYREILNPFKDDQLALEIVMPDVRSDKSCPTCSVPLYRLLVAGSSVEAMIESLQLKTAYRTSYIGTFDIERIPKPADVNRVPMETYFPPVAILRYDEQGNPVDPPKELRPTDNQAGYIQSPPLILTTLEAARALRGDAAISAIRMRVALEGCPTEQPETCTLTPAAQRKIEAIAIEIQRQTGLDVDIMVGSSPKRILVRVPGIGYVEEQWIQKGVNLVYKQGIQTGNWLLLGTLLVAGGLFTLDLSWAEMVARRRLIALQKALGWRSRTVFAQVLGQVLGIGAVATLAGSLGALEMIRLLDWQRPPTWVLLGLPLAVLAVAVLGSLLPAWLASRTPPLIGLWQGGLRYRRTGSVPALGMWRYAWSGLLRRAGRTMLAGLTAVLSTGLLVLLVAVLLEQRGMLGGTLLGEFVLVRVQGFHYAIVGIGFGLAALSTANSLLAGVLERRREIGVLKAIGWRTGAVMRLFVLEGTLLGLTGGAVGALLGSLAFVYLYRSVAPGLALAVLVGVGVPGLVGALAALYPARMAARVPPTEAVRYE